MTRRCGRDGGRKRTSVRENCQRKIPDSYPAGAETLPIARWASDNDRPHSKLATRPLHCTMSTTATATASKTEINLKGSVGIVSDFFFTAINSILYQRGTFDQLAARPSESYLS